MGILMMQRPPCRFQAVPKPVKFEPSIDTGNLEILHGGFPELGILGGPNNKDYSILGSILGFPYVGKFPHKP